MAKAYLGIGSNLSQPEAESNIKEAVARLVTAGCSARALSDIYVVELPYYNMVAEVEWGGDYDRLVETTKNVESTMGRTPESKAHGIVPIDIDVVVYEGLIKRPRDYKAEYFSRGFKKLESERKKSR